jgi:DNA-directed RNA polymerase specialized sigma24 family protein
MKFESEEHALSLLSGADEAVAQRAFMFLTDLSRSYLENYLRGLSRTLTADDIGDLVQTVCLKIWSVRLSLHFSSKAAWHVYARRAAYHAFLDLMRQRKRLPDTQEYDLNAVPQEERPLADAVLLLLENRALDEMADIAILGLPKDLPPREWKRRLLAAQLYYEDRLPLSRIREMVGEPMPTRAELDAWLIAPTTLRHLAATALYFGNDRLAFHLLFHALPSDSGEAIPDAEECTAFLARASEELHHWARGATTDRDRLGAWDRAESLILLWRYRYGFSEEHILSREDCPLPPDVVNTLTARLRTLLPFHSRMSDLLVQLTAFVNARELRKNFAAPALWQRLSFSYRYRDDLPHRDILERIHPAATQVDANVTPTMLTAWLSGGRLLNKIAKIARDRWDISDPDEEKSHAE